ncbi:hypothetical protein R1sor_017860 [Riccia sorocarpa]|uniref:Uncharacterized protein n=1 Tax=Riccia sorocarpa TaxID=122646 RepID=A0ABD3I811_9MARC
MDRDDVAYVDADGPAFSLNRTVSPASSCSSSSSNSEMKSGAMARLMGAQKNAARHRMTKRDYEMIVTYLENSDNFAVINGCGRKIKITGKTLTKVTAFGHMAVTLCAQGFVKCKAEIDAGLTLEQKMNAKCHYFFRMHAFFGAIANVEPPAVGDAGLPAELVFDVPGLCQDSQATFQFFATEPMLSGDEEKAGDREEEPIDLSEDDEVDNQTAPVADGDDFFETAMPDNRTDARSKAEAMQACSWSKMSGLAERSRDRPPPPERKTSLITAYEEQVKEKLVLRKEVQDQKASFRDAILEDRRQAREQRERARIHEGIEAMRRARADRRSILLVKMVKRGKSMDEIHQAFLLLDSVEERFNGSM